MPLATNPNAKIPYVLKVDRQLPESQQPVFYFRAETAEQTLKLAKQGRAAGKSKKTTSGKADVDPESVLNEAIGVLKKTLVGWDNMPKPYKPELLPRYLSVGELWELVEASHTCQYPTVDDKKK